MNPTARAHRGVARPLFVFISLLSFFALGTAPALAADPDGYSWCSRDPVLTFSRGLLAEQVLDVQVAVKSGVAPLDGTAVALDVAVPANVMGTDVLAPVTEPVFNVYTAFAPALATASSRSYSVFLDAFVPDTQGAFDTALIITGAPLDGFALGSLQVACSGRTGTPIHAKVSFAPLKVYCQQGTGWALAFG